MQTVTTLSRPVTDNVQFTDKQPLHTIIEHKTRTFTQVQRNTVPPTQQTAPPPPPPQRVMTRPNITYSKIVQDTRREDFPQLQTDSAQAQDTIAQPSLNMDLAPILNLLTMIAKQPHLLDIIITLATALKNNGP